MGAMTPNLLPAPLPDQSGRTWLITGATNGIGKEAALAASRAGARLILPARNAQRAQAVCAQLPGPARSIPLELADLDSVRAAADAVDEPVDVLVNCAGRVTLRRETNAAGHELMLATNLYGPFALTNLLLPRVRERIVIVGSNAHAIGRVDVDDPHFTRRRWTAAAAYAQSKLGDMLWGFELDRRLRAAGGPRVELAHPGWANTNLQNATANARVNAFVTWSCSLMAQTAEEGAQPLLVAATADVPPGSYIGPDGIGGQRGAPTLAGRAVRAADPRAALATWGLCAHETGTDL